MNMEPRPTVALMHWGDLIEDFLESIGVSFQRFCQEMTGGWMFGYIEALKLAGVRTVLFCFSALAAEPLRCTHVPTGATIVVLPARECYRSIRRRMADPFGWTVKDMFADVRGVRCATYAFLKHLAPYLATPLRTLAGSLRREECNVILCQEYEHARFDLCVLLGRLMHLPVFATFQGGDFQASCLERPLRPATLRGCSGLIVATSSEAHRVQRRYGIPPTKLARIFNPLDVGLWHKADRRTARAVLGIPPEARVVVWHGRIDLYRKGLDLLLQAWKQVCLERPERDLRLLVIGTGNDADTLRERIETMRLAGVHWVNEYILDRSILLGYLAAADVYTLPSRHEGFPVAPLEAMACGLPVVAANAQGVPDILEEGEKSGGIVVPRQAPGALAAAIGRLLDNAALRRELGRNARRRVEENFSLEAVGMQLRNFLYQRT